jgi:hypothetical protein
MNAREGPMNAARSRHLLSCGAVAVAALGPMCAGSSAQTATNATARTIVALQPSRQTSTATLGTGAGGAAQATLVNLNPAVNAWFVLTLDDAGRKGSAIYHLENASPQQRLQLNAAGAGSLDVAADGRTTRCVILSAEAEGALERARRSNLPFAPLCDGRLYLRNPVRGSRTELEATTEFLRDHVWGGEKIVGFVRSELFRDSYVERAKSAGPAGTVAGGAVGGPPPALLRPESATRAVVPGMLGIELADATRGVVLGQWYAVRGLADAYVSVVEPAAVADTPAGRSGGRSWRPDAVEADALVYLVAFDLARFDLGFALGTDHPRLGWSAHIRDEMRNPALPGPDGIDAASPLARTGMMSPAIEGRAVAAFTGGFKREHGAFRQGTLAQRNRGSHYGFAEQGVVFSTLAPGLATVYVLNDGTVDMKTWTEADDALLPRLRDARQNGVALVEPDAAGGAPVVGALVDQWGPGNWSGSAEGQLRTLRAGACLLAQASKRYLVYGYFSTATPPTMARVFQAYGCRYAMHLDMNALEHTYLALYTRQGPRLAVEHLVKGMSVLDKQSGADLLPRFLGFPDNRDFFYVMRRSADR